MHARAHDAEILQAGDWGFLWPGHSQLRQLSRMLVNLGVTMRFVDGNHDDHPDLRKRLGGTQTRGVQIAPNVIYQPRGSLHEDGDGTRFLFLGGAPSIDREGRAEGSSWWPEEVITAAEFTLARSAPAPIHVLVTHDAPDYPPGFSAKGSPDYQRAQQDSMRHVDALIRHHRPTLHVHGHWHVRYMRRHDVGTLIRGLSCNEIDATYLDDATFLWFRSQEGTHSVP